MQESASLLRAFKDPAKILELTLLGFTPLSDPASSLRKLSQSSEAMGLRPRFDIAPPTLRTGTKHHSRRRLHMLCRSSLEWHRCHILKAQQVTNESTAETI